MTKMTYPVSKIEHIAKEYGLLSGVEMVHIYFCVCEMSIECTDHTCPNRYSENQQTIEQIVELCEGSTEWVWLSGWLGGEATNYRLHPLITELHKKGLKVALETCGHMKIELDIDFLQVVPTRAWWPQRTGDELIITPGINEISLDQFILTDLNFKQIYVRPLKDGNKSDRLSLMQCQEFVQEKRDWQIIE